MTQIQAGEPNTHENGTSMVYTVADVEYINLILN
jgi:hypothetical protein